MTVPGSDKQNCSDTLVIGGGIIGMLTALELQQRGASVSILEKNVTGKESSWAGGGILSPLYPWRYDDAVNELATWSQSMYKNFCDGLLQKTGIDPQWTRSGLLITDNFDNTEQQQLDQWADKFSAVRQTLDHNDIQQVQPGLNLRHHAVFMPEIAQVRNPRLVKSLKQLLLLENVSIIESTDVEQVLIENNKACGVSTADGNYYADNIVIASGAWSAGLLSSLNIELDVQPVRGQMLLLKAPAGLLDHIILYNGRYLIPRRDGRILIGSTIEHVGFDKATTEEARQSLWQSAIDILPSLKDVEIEHHWAGLRPGSKHGIPYISAHPEFDGLYVNAGHYRNGVVIGPASAHLMADIITGNRTILDPGPYTIRYAPGAG